MTDFDTDNTCDRCGSSIVLDQLHRVDRPMRLQFNISNFPSTEDASPRDGDWTEQASVEYEVQQRILCRGCEEDLKAWIDDGEIDRSDCVDLPTNIESARALHNMASELNALAETLEITLDP